jgi:hypothetical protein
MVYCHWDGYPSNNGKLLQENYKTREEIDKLLSNGDMSSLGSDVESTVYYCRDRGEEWKDIQPSKFPTEEAFLNVDSDRFEEWVYYFKDNKWSVGCYRDELGLQDLEHVLSQEEAEVE